MPSRREVNAERTRTDIVAAATELFGTQGFQTVSVDDICAAVGLSRGGFYHHFANREECFEAVWRSLQEEWGAHSAQLAEAYVGDDVWGLLDRAFRDLFVYWAEPRRRQINLYDPLPALGWGRILELREANGDSQVEDMLRRLGKRPDPMLARLVSAAITDATFHVGHLDGAPEVTDRAVTALIELIRGLPDQEATDPSG